MRYLYCNFQRKYHMTSATPTATTTAPTTAPITPLDSRPEWKALLAHAEKIKATHLRDIFKPVSYTHLTLPTKLL
jgi:hypothetical protein